MPLNRIKPKRYLVEYLTGDDQEPTTFEVRVTTPDILDAELQAPTFGLRPSDHSIHITVMWAYFASKRLGFLPEGTSWPEFRRRCVDWYDLDRAEGTQAEPVPPTTDSSESSSDVPPTDSQASTSMSGSPQLRPTSGS